jgi:rhodanese-related sulfurtransferase
MIHSSEFLAVVEDAKSRIREIKLMDVRDRMAGGATLVDVREDNEWDAGHAKGSKHLGRGIIERDIVREVPDKDAELILYCVGGYRSALAADSLQRMGYTNVLSMAGGWHAWEEANLPIER